MLIYTYSTIYFSVVVSTMSDFEADLIYIYENHFGQKNFFIIIFSIQKGWWLPDNEKKIKEKLEKEGRIVLMYEKDKYLDGFFENLCKMVPTENVCQATPDHSENKCQLNKTEVHKKCLMIPCPETECECDQMYPWKSDIAECSVTCGTGVLVYKRDLSAKSFCVAEVKGDSCVREPCPTYTNTKITVSRTEEKRHGKVTFASEESSYATLKRDTISNTVSKEDRNLTRDNAREDGDTVKLVLLAIATAIGAIFFVIGIIWIVRKVVRKRSGHGNFNQSIHKRQPATTMPLIPMDGQTHQQRKLASSATHPPVSPKQSVSQAGQQKSASVSTSLSN